MRGVVLGGFMGVGKSTVGRALARRLALPLVDTDEALTASFGPIPSQFARDGERAFRKRELALLARLADGVPRVVATGGGVWAHPRAERILPRLGVRVVLHAPLSWVRGRLGEDRPLAVEGVLVRRYAERQAAYRRADLGVSVVGRSVDAVVAEILEAL